jgi:hypothetical protein
MMKKADVRSLLKDLEKRAGENDDVSRFIADLDRVSDAQPDEPEESMSRIGVPYVNADPIGGTEWK